MKKAPYPPKVCDRECLKRFCLKGSLARLSYICTGYTPCFRAECRDDRINVNHQEELSKYTTEELFLELKYRMTQK